MSKRLILTLVAVGALMLIAGPAFAAVQNVKVSGDLEVMPLTRDSFDLKGAKNAPRGTENTESAVLSFLRLRVDADLTDNVSLTTRLLNERDWDQEDAANTDIDLDLAYVTLKEFLYSPLTLTLGRQELHMGSEMIVGDPDTNNAAVGNLAIGATGQPDLSKKKAFDAMRATLDYSPLVIDAIYAKISEGNHNSSTDETLWGIDANYDLKDKWSSMLEGYFYGRTRGKGNIEAAQLKKEETGVIGARVVTKPIENLTCSLEGAYQMGQYYDAAHDSEQVTRHAAAAQAIATYVWARARYTPSLTGLYSYFQGDSSDFDARIDSSNTAWDPMYENQTPGDIANALLPQSNVHVLGLAASANPWEDIAAKLAYYAFWWDKSYSVDDTLSNTAHQASVNLAMEDKAFAGQELDAKVTYDYTEDVQIGLTAGMFIPGGSFQDINGRAASQVIGSMLVKF